MSAVRIHLCRLCALKSLCKLCVFVCNEITQRSPCIKAQILHLIFENYTLSSRCNAPGMFFPLPPPSSSSLSLSFFIRNISHTLYWVSPSLQRPWLSLAESALWILHLWREAAPCRITCFDNRIKYLTRWLQALLCVSVWKRERGWLWMKCLWGSRV